MQADEHSPQTHVALHISCHIGTWCMRGCGPALTAPIGFYGNVRPRIEPAQREAEGVVRRVGYLPMILARLHLGGRHSMLPAIVASQRECMGWRQAARHVAIEVDTDSRHSFQVHRMPDEHIERYRQYLIFHLIYI